MPVRLAAAGGPTRLRIREMIADVTGIEPGNCSVLGRAWNRRHGTLETLAPGAVREFHLELGVLDGARQIRAFEREVGRAMD